MRLSLGDWLKENFGLVATLLGFTVDTITLIALINSKVPPSIPFIDYPVGNVTKVIILVIAALTYLGFLRGCWQGLRQKYFVKTAHTFLGFIAYDLVLRFRHPFLLIPLVILIGFLLVIVPGFWTVFWLIVSTIIFAQGVPLIAMAEKRQEKRESDEVSSIRWNQRIERELDRNRYVTDYNLAYLCSESRILSRKALQVYFEKNEIEKELVLVEEKVRSKRNWADAITGMILAHRSVSDLKPKPWQEEVS